MNRDKGSTFTAKDIRVVSAATAVRMRPEMYIGSTTDPASMTLLALEPLCLAIDEPGGPASEVRVELDEGVVTVSNNGPGISMEPTGHGHLLVDLLMTQLVACRNLKREEKYARWCDVGLVCTNILSAWCEAEIHVNGSAWLRRWERGEPVGELRTLRASNDSGTTLRFELDRSILKAKLDPDHVATRLSEFAADFPGIHVSLIANGMTCEWNDADPGYVKL